MNHTDTSTSNTSIGSIDYTDGAPLTPDDPRAAMARSVQAARVAIGAVNAENADRPSPCPDWTAGDLARHLVAVLDRAAAGPTDQDVDSLPILADTSIADLAVTFDASVQRLHANWLDDAALGMMIAVPWGVLPGAAVIGAFAGEVLAHTWDLCMAIGLDINWPEPDAAIHFEMMQQGIAESPRDDTVPFGSVVRPAPDAPAIEHMVGWLGRDVDRWRLPEPLPSAQS